MNYSVSIVIPAKNEASGLASFLPRLSSLYPDFEIIVVDDGSKDGTVDVCRKCDVKVISHPYSKGNGASIKSGARLASGDIIIFMDGDGQHQPKDIPPLLKRMGEGYDLVVGARQGYKGQANIFRGLANKIYNMLASFMVGHKVKDLTSGMRVVRRDKFLKFMYLLPNGFSYPTTSTMAFFRSGYSVCYEPIEVKSREGQSHINIIKDGVKFFLIIFKVSSLYSPLKIFFPMSLMLFLLGCGRYLYSYINFGTFTNMSALMFSMSLLVFLIGLVSEQITSLMYKDDVDQ